MILKSCFLSGPPAALCVSYALTGFVAELAFFSLRRAGFIEGEACEEISCLPKTLEFLVQGMQYTFEFHGLSVRGTTYFVASRENYPTLSFD